MSGAGSALERAQHICVQELTPLSYTLRHPSSIAQSVTQKQGKKLRTSGNQAGCLEGDLRLETEEMAVNMLGQHVGMR